MYKYYMHKPMLNLYIMHNPVITFPINIIKGRGVGDLGWIKGRGVGDLGVD